MAKSGSLLTNGWYSSSKGDYIYLEFSWTATQSIAENTSTISWSLKGKRTASGYVNAGGFKVVIDGDTVFEKSTDYRIELQNGTVIASGKKTIQHNEDGKRNVEVYIAGGIYQYAVNCTGKTTFTLDQIQRKATITAAPDFKDVDNPTIQYSNLAGNNVTSLAACITLTGEKADITYRSVPKTEKSYTFELSDSERDLLRKNTAGITRKVYFRLRTQIGDDYSYSTSDAKIFTVTENYDTKPTVKMAVAVKNESLPDDFADLYIQGKSKVGISLVAEGKHGATIESYSAIVDGKNYNSQRFVSEVIEGSGEVIIVCSTKDSRKFTGSVERTITVIEYSKPLVIPVDGENAIQCYRSDGNGKRVGNSTSLWIKAKRSYHNVSGKNKCALQYRWKLVAEVWDDSRHPWIDLLVKDNTDTNEYNAQIPGEFDLTKAYSVQIRAIDDIGEYDVKLFDVPTRDVALHLGKGGKNVTIGSYCDYSEERTFRSAWKATFENGVENGIPVVISDTGWVDLGLNDAVQEAESTIGRVGKTCCYRVINGTHVYVAFNCACAYAGEYIQVNRDLIPNQYRPKRNMYSMVPTNGRRIARTLVHNDGRVLFEYVQSIPSDTETTELEVKWVDGYLDYWI